MERDQASASTHLESVETPSKAARADVKVSRVRKADCVASHVQCPLEVSATARCRTMMLDAGLRSLHIVTLIRAPCGRVHHSQVSYRCSA